MPATTVNREAFLRNLEMAQPGLAAREIVEQTTCLVFRGGEVQTYNDEVAVRAPSLLDKKLQGAVQAKQLLDLLRKLPDENITVDASDTELLVTGEAKARRRAGVPLEKEILLGLDALETPETWAKLGGQFGEAVAVVSPCAGKDESNFGLTCVHLTPGWLEACDDFRACRYRLKTGLKESCLVKGSALKHVAGLGVTEVSETKAWVHFRNPAGLVLSCRRSLDHYEELDEFLESPGTPATLPKGLAEAAEKADVFSRENGDLNLVAVQLKPGRVRVRGQSVAGWYVEEKKMVYDGPPLHFLINPGLLMEITRQHNDCLISKERLRVDGEPFTDKKGRTQARFTFVTCLTPPEALQPAQPQAAGADA